MRTLNTLWIHSIDNYFKSAECSFQKRLEDEALLLTRLGELEEEKRVRWCYCDKSWHIYKYDILLHVDCLF